jgi:hypothetical protein
MGKASPTRHDAIAPLNGVDAEPTRAVRPAFSDRRMDQMTGKDEVAKPHAVRSSSSISPSADRVGLPFTRCDCGPR